MSDGINEPIQFTRGDAERLATVENDMCHVKKAVNRILKMMYGGGIGTLLVIIREIYIRINGG